MRVMYGALCLALTLGSSGRALEAAPAAPLCPGTYDPGVPLDSLRRAPEARLIWRQDFPDPFIERFDNLYHGYATGVRIRSDQLNVQHSASNGGAWSAPKEALPKENLPAWVDRDNPQVWAPEVMQVAGRYVLYFNARHHTLTRTETPDNGEVVLKRHCLGAAVSDRPDGPFVGIDEPLVCSEFDEGVIDASPFRDGDNLYLYYKYDGNCCGRRSALYVQGLSADGLSVVGSRHRLLENSDSPEPQDDWEWRVVEAPTMVKRGSAYYLFYSGNHFGNINYSVGYLRCRTPRGPCRDELANPILHSFVKEKGHEASPLLGPGHQSLLDVGGTTLIFFHGWDDSATAQKGGKTRCLYAHRVEWVRGDDRSERPRIPGGKPPATR